MKGKTNSLIPDDFLSNTFKLCNKIRGELWAQNIDNLRSSQCPKRFALCIFSAGNLPKNT